MYLFNKYFHPANFVFADRIEKDRLFSGAGIFSFHVEEIGPEAWRIEIRNPALWPSDHRTG